MLIDSCKKKWDSLIKNAANLFGRMIRAIMKKAAKGKRHKTRGERDMMINQIQREKSE